MDYIGEVLGLCRRWLYRFLLCSQYFFFIDTIIEAFRKSMVSLTVAAREGGDPDGGLFFWGKSYPHTHTHTHTHIHYWSLGGLTWHDQQIQNSNSFISCSLP